MMLSYAQNHEDVLLARLFPGVKEGFYVDVGAHDPEDYSITKHFYDLGWRGINFEPGEIFAKLSRERPLDLNLKVAASKADGEITFFEYPEVAGLSTVCPSQCQQLQDHEAGRRVHTIPCRALRSVFEETGVERIDFMSIDVEGHEMEVIQGNDWRRFRPRVLVIEATLPSTNTPCHQVWEPLLLEARYLFAYFDGINRYYVREEDTAFLEHFRLPVNVLDRYAPAWYHLALDRAVSHQQVLLEALTALQQAQNELAEAHNRLHAAHSKLMQGIGKRTLRIGLKAAKLLHRAFASLKHFRSVR